MQFTDLTEINYFPGNQTGLLHQENLSSVQEAPLQAKVYREFATFLNNIPHLPIKLDNGEYEITKDAVAFYIEATKQLNGEDWQKTIHQVKEKIQKFRESKEPLEAHKETTWLLNDLISNLYKTSLQMQIAQQGEQKEFLERTFERWTGQIDLRKRIKTENGAVSIGGILLTQLPNWYKHFFILK